MPALSNVANAVVSGMLTGTVYGLMALGLSAIFGVIRLVNFAHGELMTLAMYAAVVVFQGLALDPFLTMVGVALAFGGLGYALQRGFINRFVHRAEHTQMLLMISLAIIIGNLLLLGFGPDARNVQTSYQLDSFELGPLLLDKVRVFAAAAAIVTTGLLAAFFRFTLTGKAIRACADNPVGARVAGLPVAHLYAVTFGIGAGSVAVAGCSMVQLIDVTPGLGPSYTLLAFIIVIVGGLGSMVGALLGGLVIGVSEALAGL
ncbi:MAG TPA: branched-chain amino acid ABC transporter permease, partial [Polyangia bacterium]